MEWHAACESAFVYLSVSFRLWFYTPSRFNSLQTFTFLSLALARVM